jgi:hypothetical protein
VIKTYQPAISVVIHKRIVRDRSAAARVAAAGQRLDLTPFLAEGLPVQVSKSIRDPAGTFALTLSDRLDRTGDARGIGTLDTVYAAIEPMDYIEIRMAREPHRYAGGELPIMMRGFVSDVRRTQVMGVDGKARRTVSITGHDFGKLPQILQLFFQQSFEAAMAYLSGFSLFVNAGFPVRMLAPKEWMSLVVADILNPFIRTMRSVTGLSDTMPEITAETTVVDGTISSVIGQQQYQGTLWGFIEQWADRPWNEVFIEDQSRGPVLVFRPIPYVDASSRPRPIRTGAALPKMDVSLTAADVVSISLGRSDAGVANFFWLTTPLATALAPTSINVAAIADGDLTVRDAPNCDPRLYGLRRMDASSNLFDTGARTHLADAQGPEAAEATTDLLGWYKDRRETLKKMNVDNAVFEHGGMVVKGDERLKAGRYLDFSMGDLASSAYVVGVVHTFVPFAAWTSSLSIERCTSFLARRRREADPYVAEQAGSSVYD